MRIGQIIAQWFHGIGVWLNRHSNIRMGLIVLSILFIIVSLVASDRLINKMAEEERVNMEIWANATQATSTNDISTTLIYLSRILESNPSIPTIITDQEGRIISYRNIDLPKKDAEAYLYEKLASFRNGYPPIVMEGLAEPQYLYYSDSHVLRQLHLFPYIQLFVFLLFLGVAIVALVSLKKSDQNRIWEGLARETAHQLGTPTSSLMAWKEYLESMGTEEFITSEMEKDIERLGVIADRFQKIGSAPNLKPKDLQTVLANAVRYMQPRISEQIKLVLPPSLEEAIVVQLSEPLMAWVFENLIKNAVDAMAGKGQITFTYHLRDQWVYVDITDTGKGIPSAWLGTGPLASSAYRRGVPRWAHLRQAFGAGCRHDLPHRATPRVRIVPPIHSHPSYTTLWPSTSIYRLPPAPSATESSIPSYRDSLAERRISSLT